MYSFSYLEPTKKNTTTLEVLRRRQWQPTPVLLPGKSHGRRSLVGCSPWGREESDTTERLPFHFSLSCIGEGNGNPLQCSCLENPRDGGSWWAAVCGVAQSWTQLKWLSSSSSILFSIVAVSIYIPTYSAREFQKNIYFCFIDYAKAFDCVDHNKLENSERDGNTTPPDLPLEKSICRSGSNS